MVKSSETKRKERKDTSSLMEQMLDLRNSKCYKIGAKDLVTRDNDFEMATGNENGVVGYDSSYVKDWREERGY